MVSDLLKHKIITDLFPLTVKFDDYKYIKIYGYCPINDCIIMLITYKMLEYGDYDGIIKYVKKHFKHKIQTNMLEDFLNTESNSRFGNVVVCSLINKDNPIVILHPEQYTQLLKEDFTPHMTKIDWKKRIKRGL